MKAYHFLQADWRSRKGGEPPWREGEERTYKGAIRLGYSGYHSSPSWLDALRYASGPVACVVEISEPVGRDDDLQVSQTRRLVRGRNVEKELWLFACDCAGRTLLREREQGREPDERSWMMVEVTRRWIAGEATDEELESAEAAAWLVADSAETSPRTWRESAAWSAAAVAEAAAWSAAWVVDSAWAAAAWAADSAGEAAWSAEIAWQRQHLAEILDKALGV